MKVKWKKIRDDIVTASIVVVGVCAWVLAIMLLHIFFGFYGDLVGWIAYVGLVIIVFKSKILKFMFGRWVDFDEE